MILLPSRGARGRETIAMADSTMPITSWVRYSPVFEADAFNPGLAFSPWAGHRYFAYDLIRFVQPRLTVELGSHYGCSLFAFAQAIKDGNLNGEVIAVDTWKGDAHSGFYGEEVFSLVESTIAARFASVPVRLLRDSFDDAISEFQPGSIDLLHIDGCHEYEAVRHDYEAWRERLAPDAIVLFHDIALSSGYGSATYWREVSAAHPSLEFSDHSFGLGVLFPAGDRWYERIKRQGVAQWADSYRYRWHAELFEAQLKTASKLALEREVLLHEAEVAVADRDEALASQARLLEERWELVRSLERRVEDRDATIASQAKLIEERWAIIEEGQRTVADRDGALASQARLLEDRWELVRSLERQLEERDATIAFQAKALDTLRLQDEQQRQQLREQDAMLADHRAKLKSRSYLVRRLASLCAGRGGVE
jgi:predicted O-methyltransferase YrrM